VSTTAPIRQAARSTPKQKDPGLLEPEPFILRPKPEPSPAAPKRQSKPKPVEPGSLMFDKPSF
jgi:hypothetical protein